MSRRPCSIAASGARHRQSQPYYDPALKQARLDRLTPRNGFAFEAIDIADYMRPCSQPSRPGGPMS
jgi:hypothetical protein